MDHENVRDRRRALQYCLDLFQVRRRIFRRFMDNGLATGDVENAFRALTIVAVDEHEDLARGGTKLVSMASTAKGAGTLHGYRYIVTLAVNDLDKSREHGLVIATKLASR